MNLLFTLNKNYLSVFCTCLASIVRFPCEGGYDIYIMSPDLHESELVSLRAQFSRARFFLVGIDPGDFDDFPGSVRYPKTMYYRIFAARYLPANVTRVLYLDPDVIVLRPLDGLYGMPFTGNYYYACTHVRDFLTRINQLRLGVSESVPYINTGVMLMNIALLRSEQDADEVMQYAAKRGPLFTLPDQDIITALYGSRTVLLDTMIYNLSDRILSLYNADPHNVMLDADWVRDNTVIVHYCGKNKPWKKNYLGALDCFYFEVLRSMNA
jgi:lipopolysaccharide biosynthesis glycosyltransferase